MQKLVDHLRAHFPAYVATALVLVNLAIDNGLLTLPAHVTLLVNAILVASGMGVLHARQQSK